MGLSVNTLKDELDKLVDENNPSFTGWPANIGIAATNFANAYTTYAMTAQDRSTDIVLTYNTAGFAAAIATLVIGDSYLTASQAFEQAFIAFWTGATFAIGIPPISAPPCLNVGGTTIFSTELASVVTTITPGVLQPLLFTEFQKIENSDMSGKTLRIAQAFHTATTTAIAVTITGLDTTPPPAGPLPIINICTIN